jgi:hypothetical protein
MWRAQSHSRAEPSRHAHMPLYSACVTVHECAHAEGAGPCRSQRFQGIAGAKCQPADSQLLRTASPTMTVTAIHDLLITDVPRRLRSAEITPDATHLRDITTRGI